MKNQYMTVAVPGSKKVSIASRRIGSRERFTVIATSGSEDIAERIVDGLNALQGKLDELDAPLRRDLEIARKALEGTNSKLAQAQISRDELRRAKDELSSQLHSVSRDLASMTARVHRLENPLVKVSR